MNSLSLAYDLFCDTQQENLEYIYRGEFDISITDNILGLAEESLRLANHKTVIKKRVYFVLVEGLQNITRHQQEKLRGLNIEEGLFVLQRRENSYFITTGNVINKDEIPKLKEQLDTLNKLNNKELKEYSIDCLVGGKISDKGGAGLGLIEIARKSNGFLSYNFVKLTEQYYYFYLLIEIRFDSNKTAHDMSEGKVSLITVESLHSILKKENITLNYSGIFNQTNMVNLLNIVEIQMRDTVMVGTKMFSIVVEMLQNLVKHADHFQINNITGKYGIFFILEINGDYILTTGNYIKNEKVKKLKEYVDFVNSLDNNELNKRYNTNLLSYSEENKKNGAQLGLMDMRLKSRNKLQYYLNAVDNNFSFLTIGVRISSTVAEQYALYIEGSYDKPTIIADPHKQQFSIKGKSIPENAIEIYKPVFEWFDNYLKKPNTLTTFDFKFEYINTHSAQQVAKIFSYIKELNKISKLSVNWYYLTNYNDMLELGKRIEDLSNVKINFIETNSF